MTVRQEQTPTDEQWRTVGEWLRPGNWPTPSWYTGEKGSGKIQTYESYFNHQLRTRYMELEGEFRTAVAARGSIDPVTAERVVTLLHSARESLEGHEPDLPDLLTVSSTLDLVERYMVGFYPDHFVRAKTASVLSRLKSVHPDGEELFIAEITRLSNTDDELRALLDEAIGVINKHIIQEQIGNGLQIQRLRALRIWGLVLFGVFLAASPFAINLSALKDWSSQLITTRPVILGWTSALGIALIGAVGGFLSGLLQARGSRVTLTEYQENMLKLQLKPLVGAIVSLVLFILLSWQILGGITIESPGSYFLIAFLSGFSERYFLRLLDFKTDSDGSTEGLGIITSPNGEIAA